MGKSDPAAKWPRAAPAPAHLDGRADPIEFRGFIADLFAAAASMQSLRKAIARSRDLGGTELAILLSVWHLGQRAPVGIKALAAHLHVAGPNITIEVAGLVRKRLLKKMADTRDGRAVALELTPQGRELLAGLAPALDDINEDLFGDFSPAELRRLRPFFHRLIEASARSIERLRVDATVSKR